MLPLAIFLHAAATADKPILVVCYTGQTACYATSLLRLYGYEDTQALKWGMSGWDSQFDKWTPNCKTLNDANNWTSKRGFCRVVLDAPGWTSNSTNGADILG